MHTTRSPSTVGTSSSQTRRSPDRVESGDHRIEIAWLSCDKTSKSSIRTLPGLTGWKYKRRFLNWEYMPRSSRKYWWRFLFVKVRCKGLCWGIGRGGWISFRLLIRRLRWTRKFGPTRSEFGSSAGRDRPRCSRLGFLRRSCLGALSCRFCSNSWNLLCWLLSGGLWSRSKGGCLGSYVLGVIG